MRIFQEEDERRVFEIESARSWQRSGWITQDQLKAVESLGEPPALAGSAIRLLFFGFTALAIWAVLIYVFWKLELRDETMMGTFLVIFSVPSWVLGEWLIRRHRLYRFGMEEALAVCAGLALCSGLVLLALKAFPELKRHAFLIWGLPATAICSALYARFGYLYAGFGAVLSLAFVVFGFDWPANPSRLALACLYGLLLAASTRAQVPEYEKDRWDILQACLFLGIYLILNLMLASIAYFSTGRARVFMPPGLPLFYWFSFAAIWIFPAAWLYWGVRARHRPAIASGCVAALITLMTYKPYLGLDRHIWDPAILGAFLMGTAIALSRWLNSGPEGRRNGFTAKKLIEEKDDGFAASQLLGAAAAGSAAAPGASPNPETFKGGGGSSGGGGASGGY